MSQEYVTSRGDMVDYIAWKQYGSTDAGVVEAVFNANPDLSLHAPELPAGLIIILPDIETPEVEETVTLWS